MIRKLFLIFVCMSLLSGCASALTTSPTGVSITESDNINNLPELYDALVIKFSNDETYVQLNYLNETSSGVWECRAGISSASRTIYINNSDTTELKIGRYDGTNYYAFKGNFEIDGVNVTNWDFVNNVPRTSSKSNVYIYQNVTNTRFNNFQQFGFGQTAFSVILDGKQFYNLSFYNTQYGASFDCNNSSVHDLYFSNSDPITGDAMDGCDVNNCVFYNITCDSVGSDAEKTGAYMFLAIGDNNSLTNFTAFPYTPYSALLFGGDNWTVRDIDVEGSHHNTVEIRSTNSYYADMNLKNGSDSNILIYDHDLSEGGYDCFNNTIENFTSVFPRTGYGVYLTDMSRNTYIQNSTFVGRGLYFGNSQGNRLLNSTISQSNSANGAITCSWISGTYQLESINNTVIDMSMWDNDESYTEVYLSSGSALNFINSNHTQERHHINNKFIRYYYSDFIIVDSSDNPLSGSISLLNEINTSFVSVDGEGNEKTTFSFENRTASPTAEINNCPVLSDYHNYESGTVYHTHTANITTPSGTVSINNINPSPSWYRSNPANSKYTITAIINSSENTHITGYAPSVEENTFSAGDEVTYQVWLSEDADSISWEKNGVEVATDTLTYTDTFSTDPITMSFSATDANGDVSYTWDYNPEALPVAEFSADVTSGTAPLTVQFTDLSENALSWYWDFDNDGTVDNSTQNPEYIYSTAGTYTVNLTVQNGENADSEVKELYISVESPSIITSYWNSFWAWWGMRWQVSYWLEEAV